MSGAKSPLTFSARFACAIAFALLMLIATSSSAIESQADEMPKGYDQQMLLACKAKAIQVDGKGAVWSCKSEDHDWLRYVETILYDSTDEIMLKPSERSNDWIAAIHTKGLDAPFGILGFDAPKSLGGHYYKVIFEYDLLPDSYLSKF